MPSDWNAESRKGEFVGSLRITVAVNPGGGIVACDAMGAGLSCGGHHRVCDTVVVPRHQCA
jgi:hypothetical protein